MPFPKLRGIVPPMITPLHDRDTLDHADLERIVGLKDSSGDLGYFSRLLEAARVRPDWSVLVGPEHLLAETVSRGGDGGVNGGANLHPRLFVELFEAAVRGDTARVAELQ